MVDEGDEFGPGEVVALPEAVLEEDEVVQLELDGVHAELEDALAVALEQLPDLVALPLRNHCLQWLNLLLHNRRAVLATIACQ